MEENFKRIADAVRLPEGSRARIRTQIASHRKEQEASTVKQPKKHLPRLAVAAIIIAAALTLTAAAAAVIKAILHDEKAVLPCSTLLDGPYGQHGVYASVPCILGAAGVEEVIELTLSRGEAEGFAKSCAIIREHCEKL